MPDSANGLNGYGRQGNRIALSNGSWTVTMDGKHKLNPMLETAGGQMRVFKRLDTAVGVLLEIGLIILVPGDKLSYGLPIAVKSSEVVRFDVTILGQQVILGIPIRWSRPQ